MAIAPTTVSERIRVNPRPVGRSESTRVFALEDIVRALKQRIFMVFFIWFFFIGLAILGTYILWTKYPLYRAEAQLLVESPNPIMPYELGQSENISPSVLALFQATQALLATSSELITTCVADIGDNAAMDQIATQINAPVRMAIFAAGLPVRGSVETMDPDILALGSNIKLGGVVR